ncbi:MAG: PIN domain-containing protein [Candidatus Binatia bacterium]
MALVEAVFFDTTVLLAGLIDMGQVSAPAQHLMGAVVDGRLNRPWTAWHCCLEFYAVSTRLPEDLRLTPGDAARLLDEEVFHRFRVQQLPERRRDMLVRQAVSDHVIGGRVYDLHIAEVARAAGAKLVVTDNRRHFASLLRHGVRVLTTPEFAGELRS